MTTQLPSNKQIKPAIELMKAFVAEDQSTYGIAAQVLIDAVLAAYEQEPVAWQYRVSAGAATGWSLWHNGKGEEYEKSYQVERRPLYAHPAPSMSADLHPDTQKLVTDFSTALAEKLYKAQLKYGYSANWKKDDWQADCLAHFQQHIAKGDPRDVAAYCAFMWFHGWSTALPAPSIHIDENSGFIKHIRKCSKEVSKWPEWKRSAADAMSAIAAPSIPAVPEKMVIYTTDRYVMQYVEGWNACRAAMLNGGKS